MLSDDEAKVLLRVPRQIQPSSAPGLLHEPLNRNGWLSRITERLRAPLSCGVLPAACLLRRRPRLDPHFETQHGRQEPRCNLLQPSFVHSVLLPIRRGFTETCQAWRFDLSAGAWMTRCGRPRRYVGTPNTHCE